MTTTPTDDATSEGATDSTAYWALGTDFDDPLAGVDTSVAPGVDPRVLAEYCLMLGDDALIFSQRLSEWCSRAPDLEDDIALTNIALDLLGQSRLLLARAAAAESALVPDLPPGSPVPPEDRLAFFRGDAQFRNVRLVELPNGDFAETITRLLMFSLWRLTLFRHLTASRDPILAAVATKGVKELAYHCDFAGHWFAILAHGTAESRRRLQDGLVAVWPLWGELTETHPIEAAAAASGVGVAPATIAAEADALIAQALTDAGLARPTIPPLAGVRGRTGRDGMHTEHLSRMLAEMQSVARAHPMGSW